MKHKDEILDLYSNNATLFFEEKLRKYTNFQSLTRVFLLGVFAGVFLLIASIPPRNLDDFPYIVVLLGLFFGGGVLFFFDGFFNFQKSHHQRNLSEDNPTNTTVSASFWLFLILSTLVFGVVFNLTGETLSRWAQSDNTETRSRIFALTLVAECAFNCWLAMRGVQVWALNTDSKVRLSTDQSDKKSTAFVRFLLPLGLLITIILIIIIDSGVIGDVERAARDIGGRFFGQAFMFGLATGFIQSFLYAAFGGLFWLKTIRNQRTYNLD